MKSGKKLIHLSNDLSFVREVHIHVVSDRPMRKTELVVEIERHNLKPVMYS
jgi:hypothetical protein